jgi:hypothetical protein
MYVNFAHRIFLITEIKVDMVTATKCSIKALLMLYITHKPGLFIMMFEMHLCKLMAARLKCDVFCYPFLWINVELSVHMVYGGNDCGE